MNFLKYHRPEYGHFKDTPAVFISDFDCVDCRCAKEEEEGEEDGEIGVFSKT